MLNIKQIEDALRVWVLGVSSIETIFTPTNAPRPAGQYIIVDVSQAIPIGQEESEATLLDDESIDIDYSTPYDVFLSINIYRDDIAKLDAFTLATKLRDSLSRVTVTDQLYAAGLGLHRAGEVNEIPEVINKKTEGRAQFDCFFFIRSLDEENIETIQKVEITNELDGTTTTIEKP